jgi:hypothetical protein
VGVKSVPASVVAVLSPLRDILSRDPLAAIAPREGGGAGGGVWTALGALACLGGVRGGDGAERGARGLCRGGLLDVGERRVWVIAPPRDAVPLLPASQTGRVRAGGWIELRTSFRARAAGPRGLMKMG